MRLGGREGTGVAAGSTSADHTPHHCQLEYLDVCERKLKYECGGRQKPMFGRKTGKIEGVDHESELPSCCAAGSE